MSYLQLVMVATALNGLWHLVWAVPFWLLWTVCGLGRYFSFLPAAWQTVPVPHVIGFFALTWIVRTVGRGVQFEVSARS